MTEPEYTQISLADLAKLVSEKAAELVHQTKATEPDFKLLAAVNGMAEWDY